jgi:hypothetical protein
MLLQPELIKNNQTPLGRVTGAIAKTKPTASNHVALEGATAECVLARLLALQALWTSSILSERPMDSYGCLWIPRDSYRFLWICAFG